jgi:signal transduction histidine kinase
MSGWLTDERRGRATRSVAWTTAAIAGCAVLFGIPAPTHFNAPGVRAAIETLIATAAIISATLLLLSYREDRRLSDLLLLTALAAVGVTDFVFSALPALTGSEALGLGSGAQVACDALAAVAFAAAALIPWHMLDRAGTRPLRIAGAVALATIVAASLADRIAGAVVAGTVLFVAGAAFLARPEREARALGGVSLLLAAARLQYLALPAMAPDWVTARDGLRLAAYALLLFVAARRYAQSRRAIAAATLAVERERIARDLHDGLAQDLAFIALQGQQLSSGLGPNHPLTVAARHAVSASREVIVDLSASDANSTEAALRQVADELTARFGTDIEVRILDNPDAMEARDLDPGPREEVVRIAREAIVNAARHGGADHIAVLFDRSRPDEVCLRVSDDGRGIPETKMPARGGYGTQMMRARAARLGGRLVTRQAPRRGLEVEVVFPSEATVR